MPALFHPVGAHPSGLIGEAPFGIPNNLFPLVSQVAVGHRPALQVFGDDWPTHDETGVRDYIHVMDLAEGHLCALSCLLEKAPQFLTLNLGSGKGISVLEVVEAMEKASRVPIPYMITKRRSGDAAISVADPSKAIQGLGWKSDLSKISAVTAGGGSRQTQTDTTPEIATYEVLLNGKITLPSREESHEWQERYWRHIE